MDKAQQAVRFAAGAMAHSATYLVSHRESRSVLCFHSKISGLSGLTPAETNGALSKDLWWGCNSPEELAGQPGGCFVLWCCGSAQLKPLLHCTAAKENSQGCS